MYRQIALITLLLFCGAGAADPLPRPPALQPAVDFWTRVYSEVSTDQGLLHDRDNLSVVYETLDFDVNLWHPKRDRQIERRRDHYRDILRRLGNGKRDNLSAEEQRVLSLWPDDVSNDRLRRAAGSIRFQLGQSDRFRRGLVRSGAWEPHMRDMLRDMGLPEQIAALPHVESSFNPDAYSRVGAAGIWQFTRLTGRRFMQVDHVVDQRMDPFAATLAAGQLLKHNHKVTGDWGLALTAYNHGLAGIRRAARSVGSENIADIIADYDGRNWGFASRNFYPAFLAAVEVDEHAEKYFGRLERHPPIESTAIELPFYTTVDAVLSTFEVDRKTLRELNRGLMDPVWEGQKRIPRGYALRLPGDRDYDQLQSRLAGIGATHRYYAQIPDRWHRVQRGESLSVIAARYDASVRDLMAMNNLRSAHRIRAGEKLRLPVEGETLPVADADGTYTVRRGDSLSEIAKRHGMSLGQLAKVNDISPTITIVPGQTLRVDSGTALAQAQSEPDTSPGVAPAEEKPDTPERVATGPVVPAAGPAASGSTITDLPGRIAGRVGNAIGVPSPAPWALTAFRPEPEPRARLAEVDLSADPTDYTVAENNTIEVQAVETLGHYAEWLDRRASDLRRINRMRYGETLVIGERLKLDFSEVTPGVFEERRRDHHRDLQAEFFETHHIRGALTRVVEPGDSLWSLTRPNTEVPVWLLRQYNPDLDFTRLQPGTEIQVPDITRQTPEVMARGNSSQG